MIGLRARKISSKAGRIFAVLLLAIGASSVPGTPALAAPTKENIVQPDVDLVCDPYESWYSVSSYSKGGKVTTWSKHIKNDSTYEKFYWETTQTTSFKASMSYSGSFSVSAGIKELAEAALGISSGYGVEGEVASTSKYGREVIFQSPGTWIIWAGVYTGSGTVRHYRCNSTGTSYSQIGSGTGQTFKRARVTGLTNCAKSVSDLVERDAKAKCG